MDLGDLLLRWTIRLSLALYVLVLAAWLWRPTQPRFARAMRWVWTLGCLLALAHAVCAFQFVHGWSHAAALEATARQTQQLLGIAYGGGLYWNYAFLLVWSLDAAWWWVLPAAYLNRSRWWGVPVHGFLGFMAFNGAIVFARGPIRWVGLAACLGLGLIALLRQTAPSAQVVPSVQKGPEPPSGSTTGA